jgi:hypothetical protein
MYKGTIYLPTSYLFSYLFLTNLGTSRVQGRSHREVPYAQKGTSVWDQTYGTLSILN